MMPLRRLALLGAFALAAWLLAARALPAWRSFQHRNVDFRSFREIVESVREDVGRNPGTRPALLPEPLAGIVRDLIRIGWLPASLHRHTAGSIFPEQAEIDRLTARYRREALAGDRLAAFRYAAAVAPDFAAGAAMLSRFLDADHPLVRLLHAKAILALREIPGELFRVRAAARAAVRNLFLLPQFPLLPVPVPLADLLPATGERRAVLRSPSRDPAGRSHLSRDDLPTLLWLAGISGEGAARMLEAAAKEGCTEAEEEFARIEMSGEIIERERDRLLPLIRKAAPPEDLASGWLPPFPFVHRDPEERGDIAALAFRPDGKGVVAAGEATLHLIDLEDPDRSTLLVVNRVLCLSADGRLACTLSDRELLFVDTRSREIALAVGKPEEWGGAIPEASFDPAGGLVRFAAPGIPGTAFDLAAARWTKSPARKEPAAPPADPRIPDLIVGGKPASEARATARSTDGRLFAATDGYVVKVWELR